MFVFILLFRLKKWVVMVFRVQKMEQPCVFARFTLLLMGFPQVGNLMCFFSEIWYI